ncbi:hypothetical protein BBJ29_002405 [Phytophthora kernoviae]|uniref:Symplekin C-terminal domain-containing protein n=1 Tax=Phytophthora kernoviae TaxID=325452 RepID=A0A3R7JHA1_9STRA|nr:hypothetical protein BBJ29_002405 [Phytophthora kernoviae]
MDGAEREVATLLEQLQGLTSNAEQIELFRRVQEIVQHRDPSGPERRVLRGALPLLGQIIQLRNAALVTLILQLVAQEAISASSTVTTMSAKALDVAATLLAELYEVCHTVLLLSHSTEKNVVLALQLALSSLHSTFQVALRAETVENIVDTEPRRAWDATTRCLEAASGIVGIAPEATGNDSNRSAMVWLRAWKCVESGVMLLSTAQDSSVYRDPARSNIQPNTWSLDRLSSGTQSILPKTKLEEFGVVLLKVMCEAVEVANLVLESFASDLPTPAPPNLKLELVPSALKSRMSTLLAKLATPSSALAIEKSAKRMRDPRLRRDPRFQAQSKEQPALVPIFDEVIVEEVSDWISKNAATIAEPLVSVSEDNVVQVHLKAENSAWYHEMAIDALVRILENEYGVKIRGNEMLREANQLYGIDVLKSDIEEFAIKLVSSLREPAKAVESSTKEDDEPMPEAADETKKVEEVVAEESTEAKTDKREWVRNEVEQISLDEKGTGQELRAYADKVQVEAELSKSLDSEPEILRRLELYLALCAKKPSLLMHMVSTYAYASETVRQVIFRAIEKLIKHLKQRGNVDVIAQLHGYEPNALGLVCHIIQILSMRARSNESGTSAGEELVQQILDLYHKHEHIPDSISVLIPVLPNIRGAILFPLLPQLLSLPQARLSVAITRLLEAMPPQVVAPIDLLVALHHVDLKSEPTMQKKVISAINFCVEHRHAFPSDVLLHVCRVLVSEERISKLSLRTLILSVTAYPILQRDMASLLDILVDRKVWEMEDALWKGFVKCSALIQPASFPLLLRRLPITQLGLLLNEEKGLRVLMREYAFTAGTDSQPLDLSSEINTLLEDPEEDVKREGVASNGDSTATPEPPEPVMKKEVDAADSNPVVKMEDE